MTIYRLWSGLITIPKLSADVLHNTIADVPSSLVLALTQTSLQLCLSVHIVS